MRSDEAEFTASAREDLASYTDCPEGELTTLAEAIWRLHAKGIVCVATSDRLKSPGEALKHAAIDEAELRGVRRAIARFEGIRRHDACHEIIGKSQSIRNVVEQIERAKDCDLHVLVRGETGSGKELVARSIHFTGARRNQPFVVVQPNALPQPLLENEFFGHDKEAFSGATTEKKGLVERADEGTLFLDEIGALDVCSQAKLLRVTESHKVIRLGGSEEIDVDFRLVAATNQDLERAVRNGSFREDLYYRLRVLVIDVPPLRERKEDIPELGRHFIHALAERHQMQEKALSDEALSRLLLHDWPGNVRELKSCIEAAFVHSREASIEEADISICPLLTRRVPETLAEAMIEHVTQALRQSSSVRKAAKRLDMPNSTLSDFVKKHKIDPEDFLGQSM